MYYCEDDESDEGGLESSIKHHHGSRAGTSSENKKDKRSRSL